jgi:S-DNA-T family DNA segregation ATPase FtsK/SpoIIIE
MASSKELIGIVEADYLKLKQAVVQTDYWQRERQLELEALRQQRVSDAQHQYETGLASADENYRESLDACRVMVEDATDKLGLCAASWDSPTWRDYRAPGVQVVPKAVRFGTVRLNELSGPAMLPILGHGNIVFLAGGQLKRQAIESLRSIILRLLATFPPRKARFIFVDPVGLGDNVAVFLDLPEEIVGRKAWVEPNEIEQQLTDLSHHMENVIQKYLRNRFASMEEYNLQAGEVAEPYRFLVVANFPTNFTEASISRLLSIASVGPRTGVYVLLSVDKEQELPRGFNLAELLRSASVIEGIGEAGFAWRQSAFELCALSLDMIPDMSVVDSILKSVGEAAKEASRVEVPFERIATGSEAWWQGDSRRLIEAPIGRKGARQTQLLELGRGTRQHVLIAGKTGSGKSTLLHVLITSLSLAYSPTELEVYLVDFKKGVEFKSYATHELPHARVVAIESEREFGVSVLNRLNAEMERRGDLFRGVGAQDLEDYRKQTGESLPRQLLVMDEFQELFSRDDSLGSAASRILARLVQQGRAFGIHLLLSTQSLAAAFAVGRHTYDQMGIRIALQCSDADSRLILGDDNGAARLLERPGEAIYNDENGMVEANSIFQVAWLDDEKRDQYLRVLAERAREVNYSPPHPQIVFEGNVPAQLRNNGELRDLLDSASWAAVAGPPRMWLGEPVEIKPHTAAEFLQQSRSNLLIVGQDEETAVGMLVGGVISLCAQYPRGGLQFHVIDLAGADTAWSGVFDHLAEVMPHSFQLVGRRGVGDVLGSVEDLLTKRSDLEDPGDGQMPLVFLLIAGLPRARNLRRSDRYTQSDAGMVLARICAGGPELGIHTVIWSNTYTSLEEVFERDQMAEFDLRVAMQMSEDESSNFLGTVEASGLGKDRAYFYDEDKSPKPEKFRPYALATSEEIASLAAQLKARA